MFGLPIVFSIGKEIRLIYRLSGTCVYIYKICP